MNIRFIEYDENIYIVLGIGYDDRYDPPDVFIAIPLKEAVYRSLITETNEIIIPIVEAVEITDKNRVLALWVLFGK
jgi:hypothetical protein